MSCSVACCAPSPSLSSSCRALPSALASASAACCTSCCTCECTPAPLQHHHAAAADTPTSDDRPGSTSHCGADGSAGGHSLSVLHASRRYVSLAAQEALSFCMANGLTLLRYDDPAPRAAPMKLHDVPHTSSSSSSSSSSSYSSSDDELHTTIVHAPVTLMPALFPRAAYDRLTALSADFNLLYDRVGRDTPFLVDALSSAVLTDAFTQRLLLILQSVSEQPTAYPKQTIQLAINRSDYFLQLDDEDPAREEPKQVEFNTISVGAGSLSNRVAEMHALFRERFLDESSAAMLQRAHRPPNEVIHNIVTAMCHAYHLFLAQQGLDCKSSFAASSSASLPSAPPAAVPCRTKPVILFVIQAHESNVSDQKLLEYALWRDYGIPVMRRSLTQLAQEAVVDKLTGHLLLRDDSALQQQCLVALVYYRAGYTPRDYTQTAEWTARELLELSVAVKCPSLGYHLAGSKKVQQLLTKVDVLERFLPTQPTAASDTSVAISTEEADLNALRHRRVRAVFVQQFAPTAESVALALAKPHAFVLKPQREGGGNNLWHRDMIDKLSTHAPEQLQDWILMQKIRTKAASAASSTHSDCPPTRRPCLKFGSVSWLEHPLSEIGCIGACISDESTSSGKLVQRVLRNDFCGTLVRTKEAHSDEGGLMSGKGALDSLLLVS